MLVLPTETGITAEGGPPGGKGESQPVGAATLGAVLALEIDVAGADLVAAGVAC